MVMNTDKTKRQLNSLLFLSLAYYIFLLVYALIPILIEVKEGKDIFLPFYLLASSILFFYFAARFAINNFYYFRHEPFLHILHFICILSPSLFSIMVISGEFILLSPIITFILAIFIGGLIFTNDRNPVGIHQVPDKEKD